MRRFLVTSVTFYSFFITWLAGFIFNMLGFAAVKTLHMLILGFEVVTPASIEALVIYSLMNGVVGVLILLITSIIILSWSVIPLLV